MLLSCISTLQQWLWSGIYHPSTALRIADIDHEKVKIKQQSTTHASFLYQYFSSNGYGVAYNIPLQHEFADIDAGKDKISTIINNPY